VSKISNEVARQMALALTKHALNDKALALLAKDRDLFLEVYDHLHNEQVRKTMAYLPEGASPLEDHISINTQGRRWDLGASAVGGYVAIGTGRDKWLSQNWPHDKVTKPSMPMLYHVDRATNSIDGRLGERLVEFSEELRQFSEEVGQMLQRAYASVRAFGTYKVLQERWPDAMPVIGKLFPEPASVGLPAVCINKLNADFGLPPE